VDSARLVNEIPTSQPHSQLRSQLDTVPQSSWRRGAQASNLVENFNKIINTFIESRNKIRTGKKRMNNLHVSGPITGDRAYSAKQSKLPEKVNQNEKKDGVGHLSFHPRG
jgi:hypothetical protein